MKNNIMKKWVKALRSGKYKQGFGTLKQYNSNGKPKHCCLGVLCELYNNDMKNSKKKTLNTTIVNGNNDFTYGHTRFDNVPDGLPEKVKEWSGINSSYGKFYGEEDLPASLADLNDNGKRFKTIADIIEKHYENL